MSGSGRGFAYVRAPGAVNAALLAAAILALGDPQIKKTLDEFRANQTRKVAEAKLPGQ